MVFEQGTPPCNRTDQTGRWTQVLEYGLEAPGSGMALRIDARSASGAAGRALFLRLEAGRRARSPMATLPAAQAQDVLEPVERGFQPALSSRHGRMRIFQSPGTGRQRQSQQDGKGDEGDDGT